MSAAIATRPPGMPTIPYGITIPDYPPSAPPIGQATGGGFGASNLRPPSATPKIPLGVGASAAAGAINFGLQVAGGRHPGAAAISAGGSTIGSIAGAALGSGLGPLGTIAGGIIGGILGGIAGEIIADLVFPPSKPKNDPSRPGPRTYYRWQVTATEWPFFPFVIATSGPATGSWVAGPAMIAPEINKYKISFEAITPSIYWIQKSDPFPYNFKAIIDVLGIYSRGFNTWIESIGISNPSPIGQKANGPAAPVAPPVEVPDAPPPLPPGWNQPGIPNIVPFKRPETPVSPPAPAPAPAPTPTPAPSPEPPPPTEPAPDPDPDPNPNPDPDPNPNPDPEPKRPPFRPPSPFAPPPPAPDPKPTPVDPAPTPDNPPPSIDPLPDSVPPQSDPADDPKRKPVPEPEPVKPQEIPPAPTPQIPPAPKPPADPAPIVPPGTPETSPPPRTIPQEFPDPRPPWLPTPEIKPAPKADPPPRTIPQEFPAPVSPTNPIVPGQPNPVPPRTIPQEAPSPINPIVPTNPIAPASPKPIPSPTSPLAPGQPLAPLAPGQPATPPSPAPAPIPQNDPSKPNPHKPPATDSAPSPAPAPNPAPVAPGDPSQCDPCSAAIYSQLSAVPTRLKKFSKCGDDGKPVFEYVSIAVPRNQIKLEEERFEILADIAAQQCDINCVASVPEWWQIRKEAGTPQLVIVWREKNPDGTWGGTQYSVSVPHPKSLEKPSSFPSLGIYKKGNHQLVLKLKDNSKLIINSRSDEEAVALKDRLVALIDPKYVDRQHQITKFPAKTFKEIDLAPWRIDCYPKGGQSVKSWKLRA
jgi:hypothetical protein